jgi:hypothetical protein
MSLNKRKRWLFLHARQRALERYGIVLTVSTIKKIIQRIETGKGRLFRRCRDVSIWDVEHNGRIVRVVYHDQLRP